MTGPTKGHVLLLLLCASWCPLARANEYRNFYNRPADYYSEENGELNYDESASEEKEIDVHAITLAPLDPEAEVLPASYKGVKPPGVDHMELRLAPPSETKQAKITLGEVLGYPQKLAPQKKREKDKHAPGYQKKQIVPPQ